MEAIAPAGAGSEGVVGEYSVLRRAARLQLKEFARWRDRQIQNTSLGVRGGRGYWGRTTNLYCRVEVRPGEAGEDVDPDLLGQNGATSVLWGCSLSLGLPMGQDGATAFLGHYEDTLLNW